MFSDLAFTSFAVVASSTKLVPKRTDFENGDEVVPK
jgi:hypothetical protein